MSGLFVPVVFVVVSGWVLDIVDSLPTPVRIARDVQHELMEAGLSQMPKGEFHHGSGDVALALSSLARHHPEGNLTLARAGAALASGKTFGHMDGHVGGEHHLSGLLGQAHHRGGLGLEGDGQGSLSAAGDAGLKAISGISGHTGHGSSTSEGSDLDKKAVALEVLRRMSMQNTKGGGTGEIPSGGLHAHGISGHSGQEGRPFGGTHIAARGGLAGGTHGNAQASKAESTSSGLSGHTGVIGGSASGMEHLGGGHLHHSLSVPEGHKESPTGVAAGGLGVASGGGQEIVGELMEMWAKIGGPEMLGKIVGMGMNMYGGGAGALPAFSPHSPSPRTLSVGGTSTMETKTQSLTAGGASRGGAGHITSGAIAYSGASSNTSQPTEVVYVMMMPEHGEVSKGAHPTGSVAASGGRNAVMGQLPIAYGGYPAYYYNTAGTYKMTQGAAVPGTITYTAIPVGSVATGGYSVQSRPMLYGGAARPRGGTYTAWPMTYGRAASRPYQMVAYTAVPAGQVVTTRARQGVVRPAGTAQAAYYAVQGGRTAVTTQQRPSAGVTYAALPAVVMPAQTYKVAAG